MNEFHFICQLCRDKKNIIFYKEISHLVEHNKYEHFACPYQECIDDMFVVFDSEEKLNSHLITKHKCTDAKNRIAKFMFEPSTDKTAKKKSYYDRSSQEAVNFTKYINDLKEKVKNYANNLIQHKNTFIGSKEEMKYYKDNHKVHNQKQGYGNTQIKNELENYKYSKNIQSPEDYFDVVIQHDNYYNSYKNKDNNYSYANYGDYHYSRKEQKRGKFQKNTKENINPRKDQPRDTQEYFEAAKQEIKIDYSFVFNAMYKLIKDYVTDRIKSEEIREEEFILPHEITYQLIIIIDKLDNQKLYELNSLGNFGIDIDVVKDIRNFVTEGTFEKEKISRIFDSLLMKKILIIYKYFNIAAKKKDGLFYKLGKKIISNFRA